MDYPRLRSVLRFKAWAEENRRGDHITFRIEIGGKYYRLTKMSHSAKGQISKGRLSDFARQMHLSSQQLQQFVDCTLSREGWLDLWENAAQQG